MVPGLICWITMLQRQPTEHMFYRCALLFLCANTVLLLTLTGYSSHWIAPLAATVLLAGGRICHGASSAGLVPIAQSFKSDQRSFLHFADISASAQAGRLIAPLMMLFSWSTSLYAISFLLALLGAALFFRPSSPVPRSVATKTLPPSHIIAAMLHMLKAPCALLAAGIAMLLSYLQLTLAPMWMRMPGVEADSVILWLATTLLLSGAAMSICHAFLSRRPWIRHVQMVSLTLSIILAMQPEPFAHIASITLLSLGIAPIIPAYTTGLHLQQPAPGIAGGTLTLSHSLGSLCGAVLSYLSTTSELLFVVPFVAATGALLSLILLQIRLI
ncbi:hypothetical protein AAIA72_10180 [Hahella sp. SMD15-11]|uniref:MFS transporter n=1 Tax=Thermohahella caldifontis TaxID=3142973 RepID=A0AB39UT09_9GAMM